MFDYVVGVLRVIVGPETLIDPVHSIKVSSYFSSIVLFNSVSSTRMMHGPVFDINHLVIKAEIVLALSYLFSQLVEGVGRQGANEILGTEPVVPPAILANSQ